MNGAGLFLAVAGVWVLSQVLVGDALGRLGVFGGQPSESTAQKIAGAAGTFLGPLAGGLADLNNAVGSGAHAGANAVKNAQGGGG